MLFRLTAFALLLFAAARTHAAEPLTRITEIRALTPQVAAQKLPVRFEATVAVYDPEVTSFFVCDDESGIYISIDQNDRPSPPPRPGDRPRIEGFTNEGLFLPNIRLTRLEHLASGPPPIPKKVTAAELQEPGVDCEWVEFRAVVKATSVDKFGGLYFDLLADGWRMKAYVSRVEKFKTPPWDLLERTVRVHCAAGTRFNEQRQMCARLLTIPGISFITPVDADPRTELVPLRLTTQVLLVTSPLREKVRLRGVVTTLRAGSGFNLRDDGGSIRVQTGQPLSFAVGDVVETVGYAEMAEFRPLFNAIEATKLQSGPLPEPLPLDLAAPRNSREQQELVTLDARLLELLRNPGETTLICAAPRGVKFEAVLADEPPADLAPGSLLRLTAICTLARNFPNERGYRADRFQLRLRTPADLTVLARPSWWTAQRIGWLATGIGGLAFAVGLYAFLLKKQVRAQAAVIENQTKLTATLDERQRIARELHDTLEQDLMGVTLLLDDTAERLNGKSPQATEPLTIARHLLRRSREESRSTIRDLRSVALEQLGLPAAIEDTLQPIASAAKLASAFTHEGEPRKLSVLVESSLLRIAHEGVSNAIKHARATRVATRLEYAATEVRLEVSDDGEGFAPGEVDARAGHFGLQGIRERVNKIGGTLRIASQPGCGTTLRVTVPTS